LGDYDDWKYSQAVLQWLVDEAKDQNIVFNSNEWTLMMMGNGPQQINFVDCGIYAIFTAHCLIERISLQALDSKNIDHLRKFLWFKIMSFRDQRK